MSQRAQLIKFLTRKIGHKLATSSAQSFSELFALYTSDLAPSEFTAELDRLEESSRAWRRFEGDVRRAIKRERF